MKQIISENREGLPTVSDQKPRAGIEEEKNKLNRQT